MHSKTVKFPSSNGLMLAGTIDMPDTPPLAWALFSHCFTGNRFTPAAARVCKALAAHGIACLRFDFPGLGQSEGTFHETTFSENVADLIAASRWLSEHYDAPQLLIGHSLGGAAALKAAPSIPSLKAVATIGAPFDPAHAVLRFAERIGEVDETGAVALTLAGREITISREFLEDLADMDPEAYIGKLRRPLLILHSPIDQTVGIDNAQKIFLVARYPKSLIALDKVDHLCTRAGSAHYAAQLIRAWVEPFLEPHEDAIPDILPEGVAVARSIPAGTYTDRVHTGGHAFTTDREKALGGKNFGYSPTSLIVSALAAATSQAVREAAREAQIHALEDVEVSVSQVFTTQDKPLLRRRISLLGELTEEHRAELLAAGRGTAIEHMLAGVVIEDTE
ncbi:alpha/beta fold hydrolase [Corynebacterium sp.]|uniref:bifunctional alpha/beta hydrolase/OsmC family protein n=1 Tax=Corynebacterium sp. TaxID=1720 RepID=UPI0026DB989F|nr:alpha/beta fold hydrolase [Corynebacterium sp.]MDO5077348.1 alpha/beta fold hydrolase [Corynebacterium sp.]